MIYSAFHALPAKLNPLPHATTHAKGSPDAKEWQGSWRGFDNDCFTGSGQGICAKRAEGCYD